MAESHDAQAQPTPDTAADTAGSRLRAAREAAGLSQADIAARTKIPERHIASIEAGEYDALAGRSYATGFSRTYARAVGLDAEALVQQVRDEMGKGQLDERRQTATFEPGDPSRVPARGVVWIGVAGALAVVVGAFIFWRSFWSPAAELPSLLPAETQAAAPASAAPKAPAAAPAPAQGPVVFTATEDKVWVKIYDGAGKQVMQKNLALNESYTVPAEVQGPQLWTGRPDALRVTVGGREVPRLSDQPVAVKDVPITAAALLARPAPSPSAAASSPAATRTSPASR